jgi:stage III sporulation protein AG
MDIRDMYKNMKKLLTSKAALYIAIAVAAGILLMYIPSLFNTGEKATDKTDTELTEANYSDAIEKKLLKIVEKIQGAGEANVMVTVETGKEYVYAYEERKNTNTSTDKGSGGEIRDENQEDVQKNMIVVNNGDGKETPVLIKELQPKVQGVVIVCEGGDDPIIKNKIVEAVTTVLNISSNRVCVIKS